MAFGYVPHPICACAVAKQLTMAAPKGGYDCDFVNDPPKNLECTICLLILREPYIISCCGNHFCRACVERVQRDRKPCPLCNDPNFTVFLHKGVMREVNALLVRCPQKELGCGWEGELGQLQRHLNPGAGLNERGCGFVEVGCVYECGGRFLRSEILAHESDNCPCRPVQMVLASIVKRLDALTAENQAIKTENRQLKQEVLQLKDGLADVTQLSDTTAKELQLCAKTREVDAKCLSLEERIPVTCIPPVNFSMYNYKHFKSVDYNWHSEPFYTHRGGYKMRLQLNPGGCGGGKGTHLSLFVWIMCGENDDKLQWPFRGRVIVQAYNRETNTWDKDSAILFDDATNNSKSFIKPQADSVSSIGVGNTHYIANYELGCYVHVLADGIRCRVHKVYLL